MVASSPRLAASVRLAAGKVAGLQQCNRAAIQQRRRLVVLCGWLGARQQHLQKYAELVARAPLLRTPASKEDQCAEIGATTADRLSLGATRTFSFIAPPTALLRSEGYLEQFYCRLAERVLRQLRVLSISRGTNALASEPLVLYAFSGNGAISAALLLKALRTQLSGGGGRAARRTPQVTGIIYDSAPCLVDEKVLARGYLGAVTSRLARRPCYHHVLATPLLEAGFSAMLAAWPSRRRLLDEALAELLHLGHEQPWTLGATAKASPPRQLLMLGTGDELIRTPDVLEFLERQAANISAEVVDFGPSSGHVEHLRTDPARYEEALHGFLKTAHGDLSGSAH
eukprot:TRINITY_DN21347_c0_g1_i1.p1 TRINITY_DN21347_c0_g1~~TRINITY_DN21347_c0_g1_i1.p1  ORF type:complete len:341 (+),score=78.11 TRINITY_DN21347_c0_g1_i1:49-1071(+)